MNNPHPDHEAMKTRLLKNDRGGLLGKWFGDSDYQVGKWTEQGLERVRQWKLSTQK